MAHNASLLLKLPTFILAIFSLIGSLYVCLSAYMLRRLRRVSTKQNIAKPCVITHLVFWMSFSDIMINIWILLLWIPPIFGKINYYPISTCKGIGVFGQFFLVASSCFYCVIIYITWIMVTAAYSIILYKKSTPNTSAINNVSNTPYQRMIDNNTLPSYFDQTKNALTNKLNKIVIRGGIFSLSMAIMLTAIPFIEDSYGYVYNEFECWIGDNYYQLCLCIPIAMYMLFALILTLYAIFRVRKISSNKTKKRLLIRRLLSFTSIFILTWIFPLIVRLWPIIIKNTQPPLFLLFLHNVSLGCIGLGNSIVWISSSSFQSFTKSIKKIKNINNNLHTSNNSGNEMENKKNDNNNNKPKTYKLDHLTYNNLNRHKKSFIKPENDKKNQNVCKDEKKYTKPQKIENSKVQMSAISSTTNHIENHSLSQSLNVSSRVHGRKITAMSDLFDDDDDLEFSINSTMLNSNIINNDIFQ